MTRFAAAIWVGIGLGLLVLAPRPALAQDEGTDDRCFPWQEFRGGTCVAKAAPLAPAPSSSPVPSVAPAAVEPSAGANPPACPASSHADPATGACLADAPPPPPPTARVLTVVTCNGGTVSGGQCSCPAGFTLMPAGGDPGDTCVRTNAENCLGGAMTVTGQCLCTGQVTMSGQVYDLEFAAGKCVPKRCPRDGPCATSAQSGTAPKLSADDSDGHRSCGSGMVATRHGCVPARHRSQTISPYFRIAPAGSMY